MIFEKSKCLFLPIDKGKIVESHKAIVMNGVTIKPLNNGDSYKYLGEEENIGYVVPVNKARVTKRSGQANYLLIINILHMFLHYQSQHQLLESYVGQSRKVRTYIS